MQTITLVGGPSQRKYGEHTIALIVCRAKTSRAWRKSKKTTQLTHKLLTRKQLALHACMHTYMHTYIHTTQLIHTQLTHTYSSTHNLLHTNPSPSLFSFLLSPCYLYLSFAACWEDVDMWGYPVLYFCFGFPCLPSIGCTQLGNDNDLLDGSRSALAEVSLTRVYFPIHERVAAKMHSV